MRIDTLTIVGVGLIGGSVGLAAKSRGAARRVIGVGRSAEFLELAVAHGAIDVGTTDLREGVRDADLTVVCTPVDQIAAVVIEAASYCRPDAVLTDAGSTKGTVVRDLAGRLPARVAFVGSHPLAGSEKSGVEHAQADLFSHKMVVVTPTADTPPAAVERVEGFWRAIGARVERMTPDDHDRAVAFTSHLPHAVAAAAAGVLPPHWLPLAASGFRDTTRVAAGDPELWDAIIRSNKTAVLAAAAKFADRFDEFRRLLAAGDGPGLVRFLDEGKQVRDALGR